MKDEEWLDRLGEMAREDLTLAEDDWTDPRWEDLAGGRLSPEEEEKLLAEVESLPGGPQAVETFRPLAPGFERRVLDRMRTPPPEEVASVEPFEALSPGRRWGGRRFVPALAAAAGLVLAVGLSQLGGDGEAPTPGGPGEPLPGYRLEVSGVSAIRSAEASGHRLQVGKRFSLLLRPERDVAVPVAALFFVRGPGGQWREWELADTAAETGPGGSVRVSTVLDSSLAAGLRPLAVAIGASEALPPVHRVLEILAEGRAVAPGEWVLLRQDVDVEVPEEPDG